MNTHFFWRSIEERKKHLRWKNVVIYMTVCYNKNIQLNLVIHISFSELQSSKIPDNDTIECRTDTGRSFVRRKRNRGRIKKEKFRLLYLLRMVRKEKHYEKIPKMEKVKL